MTTEGEGGTFAGENGVVANVGGEEAPLYGHLHLATAAVEVAARTRELVEQEGKAAMQRDGTHTHRGWRERSGIREHELRHCLQNAAAKLPRTAGMQWGGYLAAEGEGHP